MSNKEIKVISPPNVGWLKYKLDPQEMDYVWRCIETNKKRSIKDVLVGNISASYDLMDRGDWFYTNTIMPLIKKYKEEFDNLGKKVPVASRHPYYMNKWWVNYQKQNEFNPFHNHTGIYSFVIWMKIPYDCEKQNKKDIARNSNSPTIGTFQFSYHNILGEGMGAKYDLTPEDEGTMLFFPSPLHHQVYPFYDCDEDRISVSGNILLDITKNL
tara:strand:+ start:44 stop:682 length:639 start_codon:yes stop_codon:yes gene_type:complete